MFFKNGKSSFLFIFFIIFKNIFFLFIGLCGDLFFLFFGFWVLLVMLEVDFEDSICFDEEFKFVGMLYIFWFVSELKLDFDEDGLLFDFDGGVL